MHRPIRVTRLAAPLTSFLCATALAQDASDVQHCEDFQSYRHIRTADPGRPTGPLRQDNISDDEVREVQRAALAVYPDSIVTISGVTNGCDCEDGSNCTAQVWLALYRENQTRSLVLSKTNGQWKIGAVQSWWLQYNAHQTSFPRFGRDEKQIAWQEENQRLLDAFPVCATAPAHWTLVRSDGSAATCVDMSTIKVSGPIRHVTFKLMLPPPKRKRAVPWIRYEIESTAFDCKSQRMRVDEMTLYFSDGTAEPTPVNNSALWYPIRPNTEPAADLDFVCGSSEK